MKIIFCTNTFKLSNSGGMNKVLYDTLSEFERRRIDCLVVSGCSFIDAIKSLIKLLLRNPFSYNYIVFNSLASISKKYNKYWQLFFILSRLLKWKRVVYWHEMSSYFGNFSIQKPKEAKRIIKYFNNKATIHFAVSEANSKIIDDYFPVGVKKIVYNACNPRIILGRNSFRFPTILTIGSIQYIKGTDIWTRVAIAVCKRNPEAHFIWCGGVIDKRIYEECLKMVIDNSLNDRIYFIGYINNPEILYHSSHLYYLPSRSDSMPLVILEAMAFGKDIVYYDSGGVKEAVGEYGIFIENFDVEKTIESILSYLSALKTSTYVPVNEKLRERFESLFKPEAFVQRFIDALAN